MPTDSSEAPSSPSSDAPLAAPIVASPAKRIQAFTGDPDFMASLARGLAVIQVFQAHQRHLTVAQISQRTEIPRAAVRRCLHTLIKLGYASSDGRRYSLLPKVLTLGHAYVASAPLAVSAQPYLDRVSEQLHEATNMATLEGDEILYIARSATVERLISVDLSVGGRLPAYCTSMGRILLAALDDASLQEYLARGGFSARTAHTLHHRDTLLACIRQVRAQGWCVVDQELEQGLRSIAVPVYDASGQVLAALNVSTHVGRVSRAQLETRFLPVLLAASQALSHHLYD